MGGPGEDTTGGSDAPLGSGGKWPSASTCVHGRCMGACTGHTLLCAHPAPGPWQAPPTQAPGSQIGDPPGQLDSRDSIYLSASPFSLRRSRGALAIQQLIPRKCSQSWRGAVTTIPVHVHLCTRVGVSKQHCPALSPYCLTSRLHHSGLVTCPLALGLNLPFWILSSG